MAYFSWLWENWRAICPMPLVNVILVFVALFCGILIGGERQRREKPAGIRTLSLVCLGSAVFTILSLVFTTTTGDSGRVAAQILTGIGFLGAGVILHGRRTISGVTTAATIWVTAAIGMTIGAGYPLAGIGLSFLVNRLLAGIFIYETEWHPDLRNVCVTLDYASLGGITRIRLERILAEYNLAAATTQWDEPTVETGRLVLNVRLAHVHLCELLNELVDVPEICSIRQYACALPPPASS